MLEEVKLQHQDVATDTWKDEKYSDGASRE